MLFRSNYLKFPKTKLKLKTNITNKLKQVRIIPKGSIYVIEVVYEKEINPIIKENDNILGIDLGLNNFVTLSNNIGLNPIIINGKVIKSYNQYYNKKLAYYKSILKKQNGLDWSKRLEKLTIKRNNKIKDFIHKTSRFIVNYCIDNNISQIIIGNNKDWKREINLGTINNQNFRSEERRVGKECRL